MRRREFIAGIGATAAWPLAARAQQPRKVWRIGFLAGATRPAQLELSHYAGFLRGMRELGYLERRDFVMEWRFAEARFELFPKLAAELVQLNVDVIVLGTGLAVPATQRATTTIPIVMGGDADPVGLGYVASLARPSVRRGARDRSGSPRGRGWALRRTSRGYTSAASRGRR
jgi:putative tryptophan/tyrosine transport system substrate-binding protein